MGTLVIVTLLLCMGIIWFANFDSKNAASTDVGGIIFPPGETWDLAGSPYIITDFLFVAPGAILTIEPGVEVRFNGYYSIDVLGSLIAVGTPDERINITSNMITPSPGDWDSIRFGPGAHADIHYCNISYSRFGIYLYSSSNNNITNNNISFNTDYSIYLDSSIGNNITNNTMGDKGIVIFGDELEHWNTHTIDTTNTLSSGPVYYWKNRTGGTIPPGAGQVILANCTNVSIEDQVFSNGSIAVELGFSSGNHIIDNDISSNILYGIYLYNSSDNNITGNNASFNNYHGIYLVNSDGNHIAGNNASSNNEHGLYLYNSNGNKIEDNIALDNFFGIYLHDSGWNNITGNIMIGDGVVITGDILEHWNTHEIDTTNTVNGKPVYYYKNQTGGAVPAGAGEVILANCTNVDVSDQNLTYGSVGIELGFSDFNYISGNNVSSNNWYGIYLYNSSGNTITDNVIYDNEYGLHMSYSNGNSIINNTAHSNVYDGFYLYYSDGNEIYYNSVHSNTQYGIYLYNSTGNNVTGNNASSNNYDGILLHFSRGNNISYNTASLNNNHGIYIYYSDGNNVTGNVFSQNMWGISLFSSDWNNISKNDVLLNTWFGIRLIYSSFCNITGNYIFDNNRGIFLMLADDNDITNNVVISNAEYGIYLWTSIGNMIYHNKFIDNANQSFDNTVSGNQWDNGYPSGGNYWSDYIGPDIFRGPDQDIPGSDGIGDIRYDISGGTNQDRYPLVPLQPELYINASLDGRDVILYWDPPSTLGLDHYLIYRSTSQTDFNFNNIWVNTSVDMEPGETSPIPLRTMWNDTNAAFPGNTTNYEEQYYYVIRSVNNFGERSRTSRTVGKWTKPFPQGISTFSLPLEPIFPYYTDHYTTTMNASYITYINPTTRTWQRHNFGDGNNNNTLMKLGEGFEVQFTTQTNYTFTGMPGAMIIYDDDSGFSGFNHSTEAKNLTVSVEADGDVLLTWEEPSSMSDGWYEVYYSYTRDGFFGFLDYNYFLACPPVDFDTNTAIHFGAFAKDPGARLYYMVVPFNASGIRGSSTYSIGIWTESYGQGYDTFGLPLKLNATYTVDWYCDEIDSTWGMNYYNVPEQRWMWHKRIMPAGIYDTDVLMCEGYQVSTRAQTKYTFIGV